MARLNDSHKSLKSECIRVSPLENLDEAREVTKSYVWAYNYERLHASLNYLKGSEHVAKRLEDRKTAIENVRKICWEKWGTFRDQTWSSA